MAQIPVAQRTITAGLSKGQKTDDAQATLSAIVKALWPEMKVEGSWNNVTIEDVLIGIHLYRSSDWDLWGRVAVVTLEVTDVSYHHIRRAVKIAKGMVDLDKVKAKHTELAALVVQVKAQRDMEAARRKACLSALENLRAQVSLDSIHHIDLERGCEDVFSLELHALTSAEVIAIAQKFTELRKGPNHVAL